MHGEDREFDDPTLRTALRRAVGKESAPPALRSRVRALLAAEGEFAASSAPSDSDRPRTSWREWWVRWQSPVYAAAAAVAVAIGVGVLVLEYTGAFDSFNRPPVPSIQVADLPKAFGSAMVTVHNRCAGMSDHHLVAASAGNDLNAVHAALAPTVKFPLLTMGPGEGWTFKGAGQCTVAGTKAIHYLFARGTARISIFSFAADSVVADSGYAPGEGMIYGSMIDGQPVAGFVHTGALHCIVGSGPTGGPSGAPAMHDVAMIRDLLASTCGASGCSGVMFEPPVQTATNVR